MKINSILTTEVTFPQKLQNIPSAPKKLFVRGELPDQSRLHVAIIGSRKPTAYGREITQKLAESLAKRGAIVVNGMALGVDGIALQSAMGAGGQVIAVLAGGVDKPSPYSNRQIAETILDGNGAIISEYEPGTPPYASEFLVRNRIVSGLSDIIVVAEASERSGTLNTVSHALEQGKEVYAVPGNITSPTSRGCNRLIAQGASPILDVDEFIQQLFPAKSSLQMLFGATPDEQVILDLMQSGIRDGDELHEKSGLSAAVYAQTITMMEINGTIKPLGANQWRL